MPEIPLAEPGIPLADWPTPNEVALQTGLSAQTVRVYAAQGFLDARRVGRKMLGVDPESVARMIADGQLAPDRTGRTRPEAWSSGLWERSPMFWEPSSAIRAQARGLQLATSSPHLDRRCPAHDDRKRSLTIHRDREGQAPGLATATRLP